VQLEWGIRGVTLSDRLCFLETKDLAGNITEDSFTLLQTGKTLGIDPLVRTSLTLRFLI
jgi:hypothetical protein